jgi:3-hydroxyisobutyrate dehydrogenase
VEAGSPEQLARASTFVITCISDGAAVESVVFGEHGIAAGGTADKILVDMSTCAPAHTQKMAARLVSERGMRWLDAPISGGAPAALEGRMAIMVGGDPDTFERARPLWDGGRWSRRAGELLPGQQPLIEPRQAPTLMVPAK